jgi:GR25 family glycosyltransferase involved in LPS biosynthesis
MFEIVLNSPAFVIYVEALSPERKDFFSNNIINAGFTDMQIFSGVNARDEMELNNAMALFPGIKFDNKSSLGQKGCLLSHLKVLKHIIDNKILISTVFEDDVHFHPQWSELAPEFFQNTPKDFDIIFIGNQMGYPEKKPRISKAQCFCTHAYIITLQGAHRLLNSLLNWDYQNHHIVQLGYNLAGLYIIDVMIIDMQIRMNKGTLNKKFIWYCWNGTKNPCQFNQLNNMDQRNSGLVFQSTHFKSIVN